MGNAGRRTALVVAAGAILIGAVIAIAAELMSSRPHYAAPTAAGSLFFTVDDGKSFFLDRDSNIPPFDHQGQVAVRAYVYQCDGRQFVGYLERYTPDGVKAVQAMQQQQGPVSGMLRLEVDQGREVKRPGDSRWTPISDSQHARDIVNPPCPGSGSGTPELVQP